MQDLSNLQIKAKNWFEQLQNDIIDSFERLERDFQLQQLQLPDNKIIKKEFVRKNWQRQNPNPNKPDGGGGIMAVMQNPMAVPSLFEKVGVNSSTVFGEFNETMRHQIPHAEQGEFWATGISLVAHLQSPFTPAVHFNTRMLVTGKGWFGGGMDLNTAFPDAKETKEFHTAIKLACDKYDKTYYPKYKKWCDEYFYIKHRQKPRGQGGIFFDQLNSGNLENDFEFVQSIGRTFAEIYPKLLRQKWHLLYNDSDRQELLQYRGHYAEFNLLYDRGTRFGLETNGNIEAIFMSLPPLAAW